MKDFSDDKMKEFGTAFELYDKNNTNYLNKNEASCAFNCLGYNLTEEEVNKVFEEYGTNINLSETMLSYNGFVTFLGRRVKEIDLEDELIECFENFDQDKDGVLTKLELKYLLFSLGEKLENEEIDEIVREIDTSGEGKIYYKDFVRLMLEK
jgi:calmodulin